jgi:hypothetical protein
MLMDVKLYKFDKWRLIWIPLSANRHSSRINKYVRQSLHGPLDRQSNTLYSMGPPFDSVQFPYKWLNPYGLWWYDRYNDSIHGVYQPTNITGGPILWKSFNFLNIRLDQKQLVQQRTTTANYRVDREGKDDKFYGYKLKPSGFFINKLDQSLCD